ncbi:hypothetical protein, partial [Klebsiella pneumoniae]
MLLNHTAATRRRTFDHQQQLIQKGFEKGIQLARQESHSEGFCQQRVKSDPLTATTNGLILIHLVYSGLASAI